MFVIAKFDVDPAIFRFYWLLIGFVMNRRRVWKRAIMFIVSHTNGNGDLVEITTSPLENWSYSSRHYAQQ